MGVEDGGLGKTSVLWVSGRGGGVNGPPAGLDESVFESPRFGGVVVGEPPFLGGVCSLPPGADDSDCPASGIDTGGDESFGVVTGNWSPGLEVEGDAPGFPPKRPELVFVVGEFPPTGLDSGVLLGGVGMAGRVEVVAWGGLIGGVGVDGLGGMIGGVGVDGLEGLAGGVEGGGLGGLIGGVEVGGLGGFTGVEVGGFGKLGGEEGFVIVVELGGWLTGMLEVEGNEVVRGFAGVAVSADDEVRLERSESIDDVDEMLDEEVDDGGKSGPGLIRTVREVVVLEKKRFTSFLRNLGRSISSAACAGAASAKAKVGSKAERTARVAAKITEDLRGILMAVIMCDVCPD